MTPNTIIDRDELEVEFARVREQGFAFDLEEFSEGICCISVPVDRGAWTYVMSIACPKERFLRNKDDYLAVMLKVTGDTGWSIPLGSGSAAAGS